MDRPAELDPPPARRGRFLRRLLLVVGGLIVFLALAPVWLRPILRRLVVDALEDELDARARVQSVSFAWPARLALRGLELSDASGAPLATLDALRAELELGPLLSGKLHGAFELDYPELHLSRADGRWNWERALGKAQRRQASERGQTLADDAVPSVRARLRLVDGHVYVHGPQGDTVLGDITLEVDVDGLERPAPFRLSLGARGPLGPAGRIELEGSFTAAAGGRLDLPGFAGEARLALEELDLAGFAPALALVAPVDGLGGLLSGKTEISLGAGLALAGQSDVEVHGLTLRGPRSTAATRIARIELHAHASQQGEDAGDQHLELAADSFLTLVYDGRSNVPAHGAGALTGTLTLAADLAQVSELARGWVPLQPGVALVGRIEARAGLGATLADRRPASARVELRSGIEGLAAHDASGHALDLTQLAGIAFELEASSDLEQGTLSVPAFAVRAGPVTCEGRLEATGLALGTSTRAFELRSGTLRLEADLEKLRGTLAQVADLGGLPFGGQLSADATLSGTGRALDLAAEIDGHALAFAGTSLAELHLELQARRAGDGILAGSGLVRLGALALRLGDREPLELPGATVDLTLQEQDDGRGEHVLGLKTSDGALRLAVQAKSQRAEGVLGLQATFGLDGRVAELSELAAPFAPMQPGLSGDLRGQGELRAVLAEYSLANAGGRLEVFLTDLRARDASGAPLLLEALAKTKLEFEGALDRRADRAELSSFALAAGGLELHGSGHVVGLARAPRLEEGRLELEADLARLGRELAHVVDLSGWTVSGSPLRAEVHVSTQEQRIDSEGSLRVETVRLERAQKAPIVLADVGLNFDLGYDAALGSLHVRSASARSSTAELELYGTLNELLAPERARGAMHVEVTGELGRILRDLGLETDESGRSTSGALVAELALEGDGGAFRVTGKSTIEDFRLELAPAAAGEAPLVIEEPRITLDCAAQVTLANLDVELSRLALESGHTRGGAEGRIENLRALSGGNGAGEVRFVGLKGQLAYVPDRLGAVLAPLLPGKLSGAEEQRVHFTLDGHARDFDLVTLLAGSQARVDLGIGRFERPEGVLDGALVMETKDERLFLRGDLGANGGTLQVDGELDLAQERESPRSKLTLTAKGVQANARLAPWLARLHPAFATAQAAHGSLDGVIGLGLDLAYDAPLPPEALTAGWAALPKEPIHGAGRLEIHALALRGSPLFALLSGFGVDVEKTLDLRPIEFTIEKGRVTYAKPWIWSFAGTETTFTGSLGLDESLDLAWNVPISAELVERWNFLASLEGERLSIPLRGSVRAPRLEADGLLKDLAAKAAKRELESRLGLGGQGKGDDPATLLERADTLWSQGQKTEAAALYTRLREDFKLSLTYALNKDRIKDRSKFKEAPR